MYENICGRVVVKAVPDFPWIGLVDWLASVVWVESPVARVLEEVNLVVLGPDDGSVNVNWNSRKSTFNSSRESPVSSTLSRDSPVLRAFEEVKLSVGPSEGRVKVVGNSLPVLRYEPWGLSLQCAIDQSPVLVALKTLLTTIFPRSTLLNHIDYPEDQRPPLLVSGDHVQLAAPTERAVPDQ